MRFCIYDACTALWTIGSIYMPKELIFDNEYAALWYDTDLCAVYHRLKKNTPAEPMRELLIRGCDLMEEKGAQKWFSDDRENGVVPEKLEEWTVGALFPLMLRTSWKFWAVVPPDSELCRERMQCFVGIYAKLGITARVFSDMEEAWKWLAEQ
jgi:hypothetical protein